jgi:phosphoribosyl 1,2-cyclic phosphodiesterase
MLTHLHLDHIMGLLFFGPLFDPAARVTVWGPPSPVAGLRSRLARFLSAPLSPIEIRDLPAHVEFRTLPPDPVRIGSATIEAALVNHRGPTLGYRLTDGDAVLAYLPDHEPALGQDLLADPADWVSGLGLAAGASLLIHDAQYTPDEYVGTMGWGHSMVHDTLTFARRSDAQRLALFHHDPTHDDACLDAIGAETAAAWADGGGGDQGLVVAREGSELEL